jgi:signal transduction histidine kinase/CheY-like chemotaxis protein
MGQRPIVKKQAMKGVPTVGRRGLKMTYRKKNVRVGRTRQIWAELHGKRLREVNREFLWVLWIQFALCLLGTVIAERMGYANALPVSPVVLVLTAGLAASLLPTLAIFGWEDRPAVPYIVAIGQLAWSWVIIQITGGRFESNLHVFGSLVLVSRYLRSGPLVSASLFALLEQFLWTTHHSAGQAYPWEVAQYAGWIAFEDVFLVFAIRTSRKGLRNLAIASAKDLHRITWADQEVVKRTVELKSAIKEVEDAAVAQAHFLSSLIHDFRTPMNGILGVAESLADSNLTAEQREDVDLILETAESLSQLLNSTTDVSSIRVGKMQLVLEPFSLVDVVKGLAASFARKAKNAGVEFSVMAPDAAITVVSDPVKFRMILSHLIDNALKFTPEGGVAVKMEVASANPHAVDVLVQIIDTGVGMSKETIERVFEPSGKPGNPIRRRQGGAGLGLTVAQEYCRLLGGQIGVTSEPDWGSEISLRFTFPMVDNRGSGPIPSSEINQMDIAVDAALEESVGQQLKELSIHCRLISTIEEIGSADVLFAGAALLSAGTPSNPDLRIFRVGPASESDSTRGEDRRRDVNAPWIVAVLACEVANRIGHPVTPAETLVHDGPLPSLGWSVLLVEDNKVNQRVALRTLERLGCEVTIAEDGTQAVAFCSGKSFDLVLMDIEMPVMNGIEATGLIREHQHRTPIIALSAATTDDNRIQCREAGMNGFLSKPFRTSDLVKVVSDLQERRGAA